MDDMKDRWLSAHKLRNSYRESNRLGRRICWASEEWFEKNRISTRDFEFDTIYVDGSNTLPNLKRDEEHWKVHLIEEEFMKKMWEAQ